jgi:isoleucyl-tRNA synthetase
MSTETPLDLKKTVNLPQTGFSQKANLTQSEPARLQKWTELDLYRLIRQTRAGREKFILHDGPPYANADIHLGTAMNKILKDFIVKSRSMMGYDAPYVPGYDCHGLPIEQHVERALAKKGKKKNDLSVESFRRACREHAQNALKNQTRDFKRLGILGEWDDPYLTMSNHYEAETARMFGRFVERGYVYKGARPVYWCIVDQTALAEAEVEYHQHTSPSVYVKFPLAEESPEAKDFKRELLGNEDDPRKIFFLIWTTTPWTLPANLGIAVNPNFDYVGIEHGDEVYIVAKDLAADVVAKCGLGSQHDGGDGSARAFKSLGPFPGSRLDRLEARHPWLDRPSLLMLGDHVTLGGEADAETELDVREAREKKATAKAGTGLVHTAPGHGHDDFVIGTAYGLEIYCPVDNAGRFTPEVEHFAGQRVFEANDEIVKFMEERGVLLFSEKYDHRYPHCWRCKNPVIFRATPQWFIAMDQVAGETAAQTSLRAGAIKETEERVRWIPAWGRDRMRNMLKGRPDWCVSRQRVWGVSIPVFYCAKCNAEVADVTVINHVADIFERESGDAWYTRPAEELLPPGYTCKGCGATEWTKETDILDVWFDSGTSSVAVLENPRREELRWPADVYIEGGDQFRGWFNSSLMIGVAAHNRAPYDTVITHGWTLDAQGRAMHKSAGNAVEPDKVIKQSGAEIIRLWCASSNYFDDMRASDEILQRVMDGYRKLRNTARFALGNLHGFDPTRDSVPFDEMEEIDRWALAELSTMIAEVAREYEAYEFHSVMQTVTSFATVTLSARYFDIIKDRLYTYAPKNRARRSAQTALYRIADALARILAPILAFTADEVWEHIPRGSQTDVPVSVHLATFPEAERYDTDLIPRWNRLFGVREQVLGELEKARANKVIGSSLEAHVVLETSGEAYEFLKTYESQLRYVFIVSQVTLTNVQGEGGSDAASVRVEIKRADGTKCERCWNYSTRVGEFERYPTVCERCAAALQEIERGNQ